MLLKNHLSKLLKNYNYRFGTVGRLSVTISIYIYIYILRTVNFYQQVNNRVKTQLS